MEITNLKINIKKIAIFRKRYILHLFLSFLLGRVFLMDAISPFAISYLCSYINTKSRSVIATVLTVCASLCGILTTKFSDTVIRHLLAYVLFGLIYISLSTFFTKHTKHIASVSAFFAMSISGVIYYAQLDHIIHNMTMLFFESSMCIVLPYIIGTTAGIICDKSIFADVVSEDVAGITVLSVLAMGGFCNLYIGDISVGKALCGTFIMAIAYTGRCAFSVTCGVGLGVIFSLYSFDFNEYAGILGFCGLITGMASGLKRPGIILAFVVSARLLSLYFGGWSDVVFSGAEMLIAISIFCLVPHSLLLRIRAYFSIGFIKNPEYKKHMEIIDQKIKKVSDSFEKIATLSTKVFNKPPENFNDIATFYEITASKVCKSCGLKFICWDKEAFDTRDILNKTVNILDESRRLDKENTPISFKQKCIKYDIFINELNKIYFKYKSEEVFQNRLEQGQKMVSLQLQGMSDIINDFSENLSTDITFDKLDESKIMYRMEQADLPCTDVTVVKDHIDTATATIVVRKRKPRFTELSNAVELIVSDALERTMKTENYTYSKGRFTIKLKETERFSVKCSYISIPKKGETKCGDCVLYGKISGGKYILILSDGMGSGKKAAEQSLAAAELFKQFSNAGFNKTTSVEMINSALMLKRNETFATIDAVIIDLFTAKTEFVKAGANTTYIKTGNRIEKITSDSLPVGIIDSIKPATNEYLTKNEDIIIMISDGVHNATDDWFEPYILNMHEDDPNMIAKLLTDEAERQKKQDDDMTVAVLKIIRNEE